MPLLHQANGRFYDAGCCGYLGGTICRCSGMVTGGFTALNLMAQSEQGEDA